jgi:hypothetical protein
MKRIFSKSISKMRIFQNHSTVVWFSVSTFLLVLFSAVATAKEYQTMNIDESVSKNRAGVVQYLRQGTATANRSAVNEYYNKYAFPRWTDQDLAYQLGNFRRELLQEIGYAQGNDTKFLLDKSLKSLRYLAKSSAVYPAARYNAVYTLGRLNQQDGTTRTLDTPYGPVLPVLLEIYNDKQMPDGIRLGALVGVVRHAKLGIADADLRDNKIPQLLSMLAQASEPEGNRTKEVQQWFRRQAIQGLGGMHNPGSNGEIAGVLLKIVEDQDEAMEVRYEAARALGNLNYQNASGIDYARVAGALARLSVEACQSEQDYIQRQRRREQVRGTARGGMMAGGSGGGYEEYDEMGGDEYAEGAFGSEGYGSGGAVGAEEKHKINLYSSRIKYAFDSVMLALEGEEAPRNGVAGQLTDDQSTMQLLTELKEEIDQTIEFLDEGPEEEATRPARPTMSRRAKDAPKVTVAEIEQELEETQDRLSELVGSPAGGA